MEIQTPIPPPAPAPLPTELPSPILPRRRLIYLWIIITLLVAAGVLAISLFLSNRNQLNSLQTTTFNSTALPTSKLTTPTPPPQPNPLLASKYPDKYQTKLDSTQNPPVIQISALTDPGTIVWSLMVENLYAQHYHHAEFHHGYLYVIKRINYDGSSDKDWTDQFWRYAADGSSVLLWSGKGLDFRATDNNEYIAVEYSDVEDNSAVEIINFQGLSLRRFTLEQLSTESDTTLQPRLINWSSDNLLRGEVAFSAYPQELFIINLTDYSVSRYPYPENGYGFTLNPENLWVAYTDQPFFFDSDSYDDFIATNPKITLSLYNLESKAKLTVATSQNQPFTLIQWLDSQTLEYATETAANPSQYAIPQ
jgi:hypothetical protein